ncbi:hypothetical protein G9A89_003778 [Geosiphon pyriformis]|nr:hypothetical protein G9A89_003778 [Geosiphon pyriformis]
MSLTKKIIQTSEVYKKNDDFLKNHEFSAYLNARRIPNFIPIKYQLPKHLETYNDSQETIHYLMRYNWQANFSSPIEEQLKIGGVKVLQVGCGTGTWAFEMAREYPRSTFFGVDISPTFPDRFQTKNCEFIQGNMLDGLPWQSNYFDFVFMRCNATEFTQREWEKKIIKELIRVTKQGGWIEMEVSDISHIHGATGRILSKALLSLLKARGINGNICPRLQSMLESTNSMQHVYHDYRIIPVGNWADEGGKLALNEELQGYRSVEKDLSLFLNLTNNEYNKLLQEFEQETNEPNSCWKSYRVFGRKRRTHDSITLTSTRFDDRFV